MARCLHPIHIKKALKDEISIQENGNRYVTEGYVPCGKCINCLKHTRSQWFFRLKQEQKKWLHTYFITLTFNPEHADNDIAHFDVDKRDLQLLFKRLRKNNIEFKYYAIGEYGTASDLHHAHYHVIMYTDEPFELINYAYRKNWPYGFITVYEANPARLNYITHYHVRPKTALGEHKEPPFAIMSKGLGMNYITDEILEYFEKSENYLIRDFQNHVISLPRYYRRKFNLPRKNTQTEIDLPITRLPREWTEQKKYKHVFSALQASKIQILNYNKQIKKTTI